MKTQYVQTFNFTGCDEIECSTAISTHIIQALNFFVSEKTFIIIKFYYDKNLDKVQYQILPIPTYMFKK